MSHTEVLGAASRAGSNRSAVQCSAVHAVQYPTELDSA